jgi:hypothetical protein
MRYIWILITMILSSSAFAEANNSTVLLMLKKNKVVNAAVAEAKAYSGARVCSYSVEAKEVSGFEKGATYDYTAFIVCRTEGAGEAAGGGSGHVEVKGRMFSSEGPQELNISTSFAG